MQIDITFEERTGLLSGSGRMIFSFRKLWFGQALPADFQGWDLAQGLFTAADAASVMVVLKVDPQDPSKATISSQQNVPGFEVRVVTAPSGVAKGKSIYLGFPNVPLNAKAQPMVYEVTDCSSS